MNSDRYARVKEIYAAVLDIAPDKRETYLREICGVDEELRNELNSLLAFQDSFDSIIDTPPDDIAASLLAGNARHDIVGRQIDHYQVISPLGSGGMGEVFLAEDIKLFRKVALKLLPVQFALSRERKLRFEQEARAISALNHRNIITIHDIQEIDGLSFMATEFVDGVTLSERIANGPLRWQEAAKIGAQIASALNAAHSVGIIHRDIKPANIMIRDDGDVKVLDFGLAKLTAPNDACTSVDTRDHGGDKRVMGTINYMSPEQALGDDLDERTDIFSLGVVLYEIVTGTRPFGGPSDAAVYNAIINREPTPLRELNPDIPHEFEDIVGCAITKEPDGRFRSAADLRDDLLSLASGERVGFLHRTKKRGMPGRLFAVLVASAVFSTFVFVFGLKYLYNSAVIEQKQSAKTFKFIQLTSQAGEELYPSLSPDGKSFIYTSRESGNWDIYLDQIGEANPTNLTKGSLVDDEQGVYSPDGRSIAFRSEREGGGIFVMDSTGGSVRRISNLGYHPAWSPNGTELAYGIDDFEDPSNRTIAPSQLWRVNITTGDKHLITESDATQPSWSPNGLRIAFWGVNSRGQRDVFTIASDGGQAIPVTSDAATDWNPVWSSDGRSLYFLSDRSGSMNLWQIAIDERSGETIGRPEAITIPSNYSKFLHFSPDGTNFLYVQTTNYSNLFRTSFDPRNETTGRLPAEVTRGSKISTNPDVSPDGRMIVFDAIGDKQEDLFVSGSDGRTIRQLTDDIYKDRGPRWSPDGTRISFLSDASGKYECWVMNADGANRQKISSFQDDGWAQMPIWSPDGHRLLCNSSNGYPLIYDLDTGESKVVPFPQAAEGLPDHRFMAFSWSPDGSKLVGQRLDPDGSDPKIQVYDLTTNRAEQLTDFGYRATWLADGLRVMFTYREKLFIVDSQSRQTTELLSITPYRFQSATVSKDNRWIYYSMQKAESDIWMAVRE